MANNTEVVTETPSTLVERFSTLLNLVDEETKSHNSFMKTMNAELKSLQKELSKTQTKTKTKKKKGGTTSEEGEDVVKRKNVFDVPVQITDELCEFLGIEKGQLYSRQFVTNSMTKYIKDNELQNPENKRYVLLDTSDAGRKLDNFLKPDQPLTFFNMQRYLKPYYVKSDTNLTNKSVVVPDSTVVVPDSTVVVPDSTVVEDPPKEEEEEEVVTKKKVRRVSRKA